MTMPPLLPSLPLVPPPPIIWLPLYLFLLSRSKPASPPTFLPGCCNHRFSFSHPRPTRPPLFPFSFPPPVLGAIPDAFSGSLRHRVAMPIQATSPPPVAPRLLPDLPSSRPAIAGTVACWRGCLLVEVPEPTETPVPCKPCRGCKSCHLQPEPTPGEGSNMEAMEGGKRKRFGWEWSRRTPVSQLGKAAAEVAA